MPERRQRPKLKSREARDEARSQQKRYRMTDDAEGRARRIRFADEFVALRHEGYSEFNAAREAATRIGYASSYASNRAHYFLAFEDVQERIRERLTSQLERADVNAERIMRYWHDIATTELPLPPVGACRHCWGMDFQYQYTLDESRQALRKHTAEQLKKSPHLRRPFDERGGIGFSRTVKPNPDCPECHGVGRNYQMVIDRDKLTPAQRMAIDEVRVNKDGTVSLRMRDRSRAMENLQQLMGMIQPRKPVEVLDPQRPIEENVDIILQTAIDQGLLSLDLPLRTPLIDAEPADTETTDDPAEQLADIAAD